MAVAPTTYDEAADALRAAAERGGPAGISLAGLDRIVRHDAGDLTAVLQAGIRLSAAQEAFARDGQMLALDAPDPDATIGEIVSAAESGPLRHRYGGVRDLLIGVAIALTDGTVARSGGRVIKNVAGYDLAKLVTGSRGTLGVVLEVAVRLHPLPRSRATAVFATADSVELGRTVNALSHAPLELEALDVRWAEGRGAVLARFAGSCAAARAHRAGGEVLENDEELWAAQRSGQAGARKLSLLQTEWPRLCRAVDEAGGSLVGRGALGLAWVAADDTSPVRAEFPPREPPAAQRALEERLRARFDVHGALVA